MSSTLSPDSPVGVFSSDRIDGFGYGIAVSVSLLLLITTITLASYYCTRVNTTPLPPGAAHRRSRFADDGLASADIESGIDEATLMTYPRLLYSEIKLLRSSEKGRGAAAAAACCSICLADYKDSDELWQLPDCGHVFHVKCVDPWLRRHPTCPFCRTSPLPTPLPTPLAEVVPLAARQS